jgi:hypothetical protein
MSATPLGSAGDIRADSLRTFARPADFFSATMFEID